MKSFGSTRGLLVDCRHRMTAENAQRYWRSRGYSAGEITQYRYPVRNDAHHRMAFKFQVFVWPQVSKRDFMMFYHSTQDPPGWCFEETNNGQESEEASGSGERGHRP